MPVQVPCIDCDQTGLTTDNQPCEGCNGTGLFDIIECPKQFVGHRVSIASNGLSYLDKGILPDPGGLNDQPAWTVSAWDALQSDIASIEEEKRRING
jgi:hypothetical protein